MKLFYHWVNVTIIVILSGILGLLIGLMCGCCPTPSYAEENDCAILLGSGFVNERNYGEINLIIKIGEWAPAMTWGYDPDHDATFSVGILNMQRFAGFDVFAGGDMGMRSHWVRGVDRNLYIGNMIKDDYSRDQHLRAPCWYFMADARIGAMVRNKGAVLSAEVIAYYFQYQPRITDSSITSWDVRLSAGFYL